MVIEIRAGRDFELARRKEELCKGMKELLWVNKMLYVLIIMVISQVYTFAKTNKKFKIKKI